MKGQRWALLKVALGYELYVAEHHAWCNRGEGCNEDGYIETDCDVCAGWGHIEAEWGDDDGGKACDKCDGFGYLSDLTEIGECMRLHGSWKPRRLRRVDRARIRRLLREATKCRRGCRWPCRFEEPATAGKVTHGT